MDELVVYTPQFPASPSRKKDGGLPGGGGREGALAGPGVTVGAWACARGANSPVGASTHTCRVGRTARALGDTQAKDGGHSSVGTAG